MKIADLIAECTAYDFKEMLEEKKPKSWLKSVGAFANGEGGSLFFGIDNDHKVVGLEDVQHVGEDVSSFVRDRMDPLPEVELIPQSMEGKDILQLKVKAGKYTPYYYVADGQRVAFVRMGDESIPATDEDMMRLVLKGSNKSYDSLHTDYRVEDNTFVILANTFKERTGNEFKKKFLRSFGLTTDDEVLTNAGVLFSDDCKLSQSRLYCTRWEGREKSDAINDAEFKGNILILLREAENFVKSNTRKGWEKLPDGRKNKPEYAERAILEGLVNHFIHRDYTVMGGEVHLDIYDDRIAITSPGGMYNGQKVQELDIEDISSDRRNPILADVMAQLDYMEKRGSGLKRICEETAKLESYRDDRKPAFKSDAHHFTTVIYSMEYEADQEQSRNSSVLSSDQAVTKSGISWEQAGDKLGLSWEEVEKLFISSQHPSSLKELKKKYGWSNSAKFKEKYLNPLLSENILAMSIPSKPTSPNQKYYLTEVGFEILHSMQPIRQAEGVSEGRVERLVKEFDEVLSKFPIHLPQMEGRYDESLPVVDVRCFQSAYKMPKSMFADDGQWVYDTPDLYLTEIQGNIWQHYNVQFLLHRPDAVYNIRFSEIKEAFKALELDGRYAVITSINLGTYDSLYGGDKALVETYYGYLYGDMSIYRVPSSETYLIIVRKEFLPRCEAKVFEGENQEYKLINERHLLYSNVYNMSDENDGFGLTMMRDIRFCYPAEKDFRYVKLVVDRMEQVESELRMLNQKPHPLLNEA